MHIVCATTQAGVAELWKGILQTVTKKGEKPITAPQISKYIPKSEKSKASTLLSDVGILSEEMK